MGVSIIKTKVKRIQLPKNKRVIAISDIHGNLKLFQRLLEKINYSQDDILVLVGDIIEKGNMSLETLRYIIELAKCNTVHVVSGNCDSLWEDIKYEIDEPGLLRYMLLRKHTILNEMCQALSIEVNENSDIKYIKKEILKNFSYELDWLEQLPHIIETQDFIFAHAGIKNEALEEQEAKWVMRNNAFIEQGLVFSKYVVVGHWPVINYCKTIGCYNPIVDKERRVISIDGGNMIKREGQLNALIISDDSEAGFDYAAIDELPKGVILKDQSANSDTIQITWMDNAVEVLEEGEEFSWCRHLSTGHALWILNKQLFSTDKGICADDCTDYFLPVKKGDVVSIVERTNRGMLVKKDGFVGWVANEMLVWG